METISIRKLNRINNKLIIGNKFVFLPHYSNMKLALITDELKEVVIKNNISEKEANKFCDGMKFINVRSDVGGGYYRDEINNKCYILKF